MEDRYTLERWKMLQIFLKGKHDILINSSSIKSRRVIMTKQCLHSQDYHCPINYDESEYYVNILSRRNRSETTDRNIELYRAFWQSSLSNIPTVENAKTIFRIVPRKY